MDIRTPTELFTGIFGEHDIHFMDVLSGIVSQTNGTLTTSTNGAGVNLSQVRELIQEEIAKTLDGERKREMMVDSLRKKLREEWIAD